jgi:hypothetical protein
MDQDHSFIPSGQVSISPERFQMKVRGKIGVHSLIDHPFRQVTISGSLLIITG